MQADEGDEPVPAQSEGYRWAQGRAQYLRVVLTGRQQQALVEWAWMHGDPEVLATVRGALVGLNLERGLVESLHSSLMADHLTALAEAFGAAMESMADVSDLSSDEKTLIHRVRRMQDGALIVHVRHGTPVIEPTRHWRWGEGKRRTSKQTEEGEA